MPYIIPLLLVLLFFFSSLFLFDLSRLPFKSQYSTGSFVNSSHPTWLLLVRTSSPSIHIQLLIVVKEKIRTTITDLLKINHPVMLAGMNVAAGPRLAAAVTNAGGIGVIGGLGYTPEMLREQITELKSYLIDKNAPFGVDLLIPQVGGAARKTK